MLMLVLMPTFNNGVDADSINAPWRSAKKSRRKLGVHSQ
ncbi:MAG: hypothetical protein ACI87E_000393 [Mariniblastus sp.]|jgi:hypothetical protein